MELIATLNADKTVLAYNNVEVEVDGYGGANDVLYGLGLTIDYAWFPGPNGFSARWVEEGTKTGVWD